jgi:hypothetical protein
VAALDDELVVPLSELAYVASPHGAGLVLPRLRFQHDRIQRAAYALMSLDDQQRMHLRIGQLLLAGASPAELDDRLFDVVSHLKPPGHTSGVRSLPPDVVRCSERDWRAGRVPLDVGDVSECTDGRGPDESLATSRGAVLSSQQ